MTRSKITVLCEDKQQEAFIRRFCKKRNREIYAVPRSKTSAGSGEQSPAPASLEAACREYNSVF